MKSFLFPRDSALRTFLFEDDHDAFEQTVSRLPVGRLSQKVRQRVALVVAILAIFGALAFIGHFARAHAMRTDNRRGPTIPPGPNAFTEIGTSPNQAGALPQLDFAGLAAPFPSISSGPNYSLATIGGLPGEPHRSENSLHAPGLLAHAGGLGSGHGNNNGSGAGGGGGGPSAPGTTDGPSDGSTPSKPTVTTVPEGGGSILMLGFGLVGIFGAHVIWRKRRHAAVPN